MRKLHAASHRRVFYGFVFMCVFCSELPTLRVARLEKSTADDPYRTNGHVSINTFVLGLKKVFLVVRKKYQRFLTFFHAQPAVHLKRIDIGSLVCERGSSIAGSACGSLFRFFF